MKNLTFAALTLLLINNAALAQCSKSRPVRTGPPLSNWNPPGALPVRGVVVKSCHTPVFPERATEVPAPPEPVGSPERGQQRVRVAAGQQVTISGSNLGSRPGSVVVRLGQMTLPARVTRWSAAEAVVVLPAVPLAGDVPATVEVRTAAGQLADQMEITLQAPSAATTPGQPAGAERPIVTAGQTVTLDGAAFGQRPGQVRMVIGAVTLNARVLQWNDGQVQATLPSLALQDDVPASVQVLTADGQVANQVDVTFRPPTSPGVDAPAPAAPALPLADIR